MEMNSWIASFYAQRNMPSWFSIASTVAGVIGVLLGGFGKGDVAKKEAPAS
jgi:hypothetical protein